jgi:hypothetical protein
MADKNLIKTKIVGGDRVFSEFEATDTVALDQGGTGAQTATGALSNLGITDVGSGAIITVAERTAIATAGTDNTGSVTIHSDVTDAGSGQIITVAERADINGSVTVHSDVTDAGSGQIITVAERADINGSVTVHSDVTDAGSGQIITVAERTAIATAGTDNTGSVTVHSDVTDAGSGQIITVAERADINGSVTVHSDVTDAGSGQIITVAERTLLNSASQTGGLGNGSVTFVDAGVLTESASFNYDAVSNTLTVSNLTVTGTSTIIDSTNLDVSDAVISLANGNTTDTLDIGLIGERLSDNVAMFWDESADQFAVCYTLSTGSDTAITPSSYADFRADALIATSGDFGSGQVSSTYIPLVASDLTNKLYVDNAVAGVPTETPTSLTYSGTTLTYTGETTTYNVNLNNFITTSQITDVGSGQVITVAERATLGTALQSETNTSLTLAGRTLTYQRESGANQVLTIPETDITSKVSKAGDTMTGTLTFQNGTGTGTITRSTTAFEIQSYNGGPLLLNLLGNNVGIGTSAPAVRLHVNTEEREVARFQSTEDGFISFYTGDVRNGFIQVQTSFLNIGADGARAIRLRTNNINRLTVGSNGDVGIGANNPLARLHVNTSSAEVARFESSSNPNITIYNSGVIQGYIQGLSTHFRIAAGGTKAIRLVTDNLERININGTTGTLSCMSTTGAFISNQLTTTQRDALTAEAGMQIYNTTTNKHQGYNGTTWNDFY